MKIWCLLVFAWLGGMAQAQTLRLAVTTSFENSGLASVLLPAIVADTGINVQLLVVGTGQALRLGAAGDVDAVIVHAPEAERAFVVAGDGLARVPFMWNDFVLLGPAGALPPSAAEAFAQIAARGAPFVSRGDNSGTHQREMQIWAAAGIVPQGAWYRAVGAGMGAALTVAAAMEAYILSDRASWLAFGNPGTLGIVLQGDAAFHNQYSFIAVNPARHPHLDGAGAQRLQDWLMSDRARDVINGYRLGETQLFTWNARP